MEAKKDTEIKCSACGKKLGLSGTFWEAFRKRHPNLRCKGCVKK